MYCTYCNHPNKEGNKFCEACGRPLVSKVEPVAVKQPVYMTPLTEKRKSKWSRKLPSIGAGAIIICFFLPWILVSCSVGIPTESPLGLSFTGFQLASGGYPTNQLPNDLKIPSLFGELNQSDFTSSSSKSDAFPWLFIIPLMALVGFFSINGKVWGSILAILAGLIGILVLVIFTIGVIYINNETSLDLGASYLGFRLLYQEGFWGSWIGLLWQTIVAIITVR